MIPRIILIGGAPTVGKSFLAKRIGKDLKVPWISTDTIRQNMWKTVSRREDYPHLFSFKDREALPYLSSRTPEEIVDDQNLENIQVWKGIEDFIAEGSLGHSYIIEGIAILPKQAAALMKKDPRIRTIFLIDHNADWLRDVIYTRGLWDDAFKYPDSVKDKELQWVILFNSWIESECALHKLPTVEKTTGSDDYIAKVKGYLT